MSNDFKVGDRVWAPHRYLTIQGDVVGVRGRRVLLRFNANTWADWTSARKCVLVGSVSK